MQYPMISQRVFNTPLLVDPVKGHAFLTGFGGRLTEGRLRLPVAGDDPARLERASRVQERASILGGELVDSYRARGRRMFSLRDGIAIVEVTGTLVHRGDWLGESSGATSYEGLGQQIEAAAVDPAVRGIALEIDSYGGEVAGVFDLADAIRAARARKPVWAFVAESALSAGYALASQADRIILPRTGEVGSIGVLIVHADYSQRLSDEGVAITMIHAGAHKVDGNPYEPLPEAVREALQAETENLRMLFADTVAAGRLGRLDAAGAVATQARVLRGARAVEAGLADEVSDLRAAFASFADHIHRRQPAAISIAAQSHNQKEPAMSGTNTNPPVADAQPTPPVTEEGAEAVETTVETGVETHPSTNPIETSKAPEEDASAEGDTATAGAAAPAAARKAAGTMSRSEAASIAEVASQAARLGVVVNVADAIREGVSADALRARVMEQASARSDATAIVPVAPAAGAKPKESPVVVAAKRAAAQAAARVTQ